MRLSILIPILIFLTGFSWIGIESARAGVHACVFEGGGSASESLCGRAEYISTVHRAYAGAKVTSEHVLSGDGNNPSPDCHPRYYDTNLPVSCEGGRESSQEVSSSAYGLPAIQNSSLPETSPLTQQYQLMSASISNVGVCLPKRQEAPPSEVCHFWSANHGMESGTITAYGAGGIDPNSFSQMISPNSACATTRFITNNCHSGAMATAIFESDHKTVRPGVCGVSATSRREVARGSSTSLGTLPTSKGTVHFTGITYNFTEEIAKSMERQKQAGKSPTLDRAFADAYLNDPMGEVPVSTSFHYLDTVSKRTSRTFGIDADFENHCQLQQILGNDPLNADTRTLQTSVMTAAAKVGVGGLDALSNTEQEMARQEIALQKQRLLEFEKAICARNYPEECNDQTASAFILKKFKDAFINPVERNHAALIEARKEYATSHENASRARSQRYEQLTAAETAKKEAAAALEAVDRQFTQGYMGIDGRVAFAERKLTEAQETLKVAKGKDQKEAATQKLQEAQALYESARTAAIEYPKAKADASARLTAAKALVEKLQTPSPSEAHLLELESAASQKERSLEDAMRMDSTSLAPKGGFSKKQTACGDDGGADSREKLNRDFLRYEQLRQIQDQTLRLFAEGTPEDIQGYLTVRACETSPFMSAAPGTGTPQN